MFSTDTRRGRLARLSIPAALFLFALTIRVRGITTHFWLLGDQIRDWSIALRPFTDLPLVGPPTHVHGYTIGPAYYWIMWAVRVSFGPWFDNLPHAGGIGQAVIESAADALLLIAVWRSTQSLGLALAALLVIVTASYDVALSAIVWTTVIASALGKVAIALMLLGWHRRGSVQVALITAFAWGAVHVYTGAIFVTCGVFAALLLDPLVRRDWREAQRHAAVMVVVVSALQVPYLVHQYQNRFDAPAMGAVTGSVWRILSGDAPPEIGKSLAGYAAAFDFIEVAPWQTPIGLWALLGCGGVVAVRYRRDPILLALLLLPQAAAVIGYALYLGALDHYYYISIMPAAVLTMCFAIALPAQSRAGRTLGIVAVAAAIAIVPARLRFAATMHRMPEYEVLVKASRDIVRLGQPMRAIRTTFPMPPTSDSEFIFKILGGRVQRGAPWHCIIRADGQVDYYRITD
jgi:hypothetical protein